MRHYLPKLGIVAAACLAGVSASGQAPADTIQSSSPRNNHRWALGLRYADGEAEERGVSVKYFITTKSALHLTVSRLYHPQSIVLSGSYERHKGFSRYAGFRYFYGAGLSFLLYESDTKASAYLRTRTQVAANAQVGLLYTLKSLPLSVGADAKGLFGLQNNNPVYTFGLSAHYLLGI